MIFIDIDGTLIDFIGTAKKFGIDMDPSVFGQWKWGADGYPTPARFYERATPQPWYKDIIHLFPRFELVTTDNAELKTEMLQTLVLEAPNKSILCCRPTDFLIDDDPSQCEAWRRKGGLAYHLDLSDYYKNGTDPFKKFLEYWRLDK